MRSRSRDRRDRRALYLPELAPTSRRAFALIASTLFVSASLAFGGAAYAGGLDSHPAALIGAPGRASGGYALGGSSGGVFLGVDVGRSAALGVTGDAASGAWTFGARAGYQLRNGVAFQFRYDDLGVAPFSHEFGGPQSFVQVGSAGLRYTVPFFLPEPFVEVDAGSSYYLRDFAFAGSIGVGVTLPIGRHFGVDIVGRDWLTPIRSDVRQILTLQVGAAVSFGASGR